MGLIQTISGHGPNREFIGAAQGGRIWWVAPSYPIANEIIWPDLKRACSGAWIEKSEAEHSIRLPGDGVISVKSADNPDSLRGAGLDGLVMDEAAFTKKNVWQEVLRPALSDREGWATFISTPNGMNWFYDLFQLADGAATYERWQQPTADNPCIAASELLAAKKQIGSRAFAQEYEAKFASVAGAEWPAEYFGDHLWAGRWPDAFDISAMACDPSKGRDHGDYSAIVFVGLSSGLWWIDASVKRRPVERIVTDYLIRYAALRPDFCGCEANSFQDLLAEEMQRQVTANNLPPITVQKLDNRVNKAIRISRIGPYLEQGLLRIRDNEGGRLLVSQLQEFPLGDHDDGPDALEMALRLVGRQQFEEYEPEFERPERIRW